VQRLRPEELQRLAEVGCRRAARWVPSAGRDVVEGALEHWEGVVAEFTGEA
jgi:hypothetical protein